MSGASAIDVQAHLFPPSYIDALRAVAAGSDARAAEIAQRALSEPRTASDPVFTGALAERLDLMDAGGVHMQVLSLSAPNIWSDDAEVRRNVTAAFNDGCADVVRQHPGRFAFVATLPLPHVDVALEELARAMDVLGAVGVSICTQLDGLPVDADRFADVYAELDRRHATVLLHPDGFSVPGHLDDHGMEWAIGAPFDDTIVVLRLIYGGVLDAYPNIRWVVPHLGGTIPFLARRIDMIWQHVPELQLRSSAPPTERLRELWFDTVNPDPASIAQAADVVGWDRLLYGSDFPYVARRDLRRGIDAIAQAGADPAQQQEVAGARAAQLLGLEDVVPGGTP